MTSPDMYAIELRHLSKLEFNADLELYGKPVGNYPVKVTKIIFSRGQPEMGNPHRYSICGEAFIESEVRKVLSVVEDDTWDITKGSPEKLPFHLMGGENIPKEWLTKIQ